MEEPHKNLLQYSDKNKEKKTEKGFDHNCILKEYGI